MKYVALALIALAGVYVVPSLFLRETAEQVAGAFWVVSLSSGFVSAVLFASLDNVWKKDYTAREILVDKGLAGLVCSIGITFVLFYVGTCIDQTATSGRPPGLDKMDESNFLLGNWWLVGAFVLGCFCGSSTFIGYRTGRVENCTPSEINISSGFSVEEIKCIMSRAPDGSTILVHNGIGESKARYVNRELREKNLTVRRA